MTPCYPWGAQSHVPFFRLSPQRFSGSRFISCLSHGFLIIAPSFQEAWNQLQTFLKFCEECGIPIALEKTMTLHDFQLLLGHLNFACKVVVLGRTFLCRLYALTHKAQKPYHHLKMTKEVKAHLWTWFNFLSESNGRSFFLLDSVHTERSLKLYTDSSKSIGYGAVLADNWLYGTWRECWKAYDITFLELYPIVLSSTLWASQFSERTIEFHTDNLALVSILNKSSSGKPHTSPSYASVQLRVLRYTCAWC